MRAKCLCVLSANRGQRRSDENTCRKGRHGRCCKNNCLEFGANCIHRAAMQIPAPGTD